MNDTDRTIMHRKLKSLALVAACAAVTLAASQCASSSRSGGQAAAGGEGAAPAGDPATAHWTRGTTARDIAGWTRRNCRPAWHYQECVEKALVSSIDSAGVDKAMGALLLLAGQDSNIARDGHVFAHGIGIAAYRSAETVGQTFALCTADFQSGCYHGVIQAYFADKRGGEAGVTSQKLNALCQPYRSASGRWLQFQCAHGIGHGVMAVESHHLLRALDSCDLLNDTFEKQACWGGAFMENVVNATQPHHQSVTQVADVDEHAGHHGAASAPADSAQKGHEGHDMSGHEGHDMAGMDHGEHGGATAFKALDAEDPLYPCNVVKVQHRHACWLMQTSAILWRNNGDFRDAAEKCGTVKPEELQRTCFISLGRDANSWASGNRERAIGLCGRAPDVAQPFCIIGVVKNIVDVTADARDGISFCRMVPDNSKPSCYHAVGQEIGLLNATAAGRERACRDAEGYVGECRRGAGLPLLPTEE